MKRGLLSMAVLALSLAGASPVSAQTWVGSAPAAGTFYLYNVGVGQWYCGGNAWGTHASLGQRPEVDVILTPNGSGYSIDTQLSNGGDNHYLNGEWSDGSAQAWTFTAGAQGYIINNGAGNLAYSGNGTNLTVDASITSFDAEWLLVSKDELLATLSAATLSQPVDATFLVKAPSFGRNDTRESAWKRERSGGNMTVSGPNENRATFGCEMWNNTFDFYQDITGFPEGVYEFTVDGYGTNGTTYMYINDSEAAFVNTTSAANFRTALDQIAAGNHTGNTTGKVLVASPTTSMRIGIKRTENKNQDWTVFDNVRLLYYGNHSLDEIQLFDATEAYNAALAAANAVAAPQSATSKIAYSVTKGLIVDGVDLTDANSLNEAATALNGLVSENEKHITAYEQLLSASTRYDITPYESASQATVTAFNTALSTLTTGYDDRSIETDNAATVIAELDAAFRALVASQNAIGADVSNALVNAAGNEGSSTSVEGWTITTSEGENFHINTWSNEGTTDGSGMVTPFIENWRWSGSGNLSDKTISQTIEGLIAGKYYTIEVLARLYSETGAQADGVSLFANDETCPLSSGVYFTNGSKKGVYDTYSLQVPADEEGKLTVGFKLENAVGNWLAFKNFKITYIEKASPRLGAPRFTPAAGDISVGRIAGKGVTVKFGSASGLVDLEQVIREKKLGYEVEFELYENGTSIDTYTLSGTYSNDKTPQATMFQDVDFAIGNSYEVRVNATKSKLINNDADPAEEYVDNKSYTSGTFNVVLLAPGDYFIQNAESGYYLGGANSWGTRASLVKHGIDWGMDIKDAETLGNNVYVLDSKISNGGESHFFNGCGNDLLFIDQIDDNGSNGHNLGWTIASIGGGLYTIQNAEGKYLIEESKELLCLAQLAEESEVKDADDNIAPKAQWRMFNSEDLLTECEDATPNSPVDVTSLIPGANYSRNDQRNSAWQGAPTINGDPHAGFAAEKYETSFDVYQTLTGMPKGAYEIHVQGYYRAGTSAAVKAAREAGNEVLNATFYATGKSTSQQTVMSIFDEFDRLPDNARNAQTENIPNSMSQGVYAFNAGLYNHTFNVTVGDDGVLTIGVKRDGGKQPAANWTMWDNWEVYYLGAAETTLNDPGQLSVKLVAASNNSEVVLSDGDQLTGVTNDQVKNGVVIAFDNTDVKNAYNSAFRTTALIKNLTTGEIIETWGNADEDNVFTLARGYFGPRQKYEVTIEDIEYLDFTRFCDDPDLTPANPMYAYINSYALDENGNMIQVIGSDGNGRVDEDGNPIYKKTHDGCDPLPLWSGKKEGILPMTFTLTTDRSVVRGDTSGINFRIIRQGEAIDSETAINGIEATTKDAVIYNLAGQRVQTARQGIYVVNGKKVVVK